MSKSKIEEKVIDHEPLQSFELDESIETVEEPKVIEHPKSGWFFPNHKEGLPFGIETDEEEALKANEEYLASHKENH